MTTARGRLDDQLCFALYTASNGVIRAYRPLLAPLGLTFAQYLVMMALWDHDDVAVHDIGRRVDIPANSVTPVVRRLVAAGWLTRHADSQDGRVIRVRLTDAGRQLEQAAVQVQRQVLQRTGLSTQADAALRTVLHELAESTSRSTDPALIGQQ